MVLDTNILIAYLGGEPLVVDQIQAWRKENVTLFISSIAECELFSYSKLTHLEKMHIEEFISDHLVPVPFDGTRARRAAYLRQQIPSLKIPDAAIAALALEVGTPLVTRNVRDFKKVPELTLTVL